MRVRVKQGYFMGEPLSLRSRATAGPATSSDPKKAVTLSEELRLIAEKVQGPQKEWLRVTAKGKLTTKPSGKHFLRTWIPLSAAKQKEYRDLATHFEKYVNETLKEIDKETHPVVKKSMMENLEVIVRTMNKINAFAKVRTAIPEQVKSEIATEPVRRGTILFHSYHCNQNVLALCATLSRNVDYRWQQDRFDKLFMREVELYERNGNMLLPNQKERVKILQFWLRLYSCNKNERDQILKHPIFDRLPKVNDGELQDIFNNIVTSENPLDSETQSAAMCVRNLDFTES